MQALYPNILDRLSVRYKGDPFTKDCFSSPIVVCQLALTISRRYLNVPLLRTTPVVFATEQPQAQYFGFSFLNDTRRSSAVFCLPCIRARSSDPRCPLCRIMQAESPGNLVPCATIADLVSRAFPDASAARAREAAAEGETSGAAEATSKLSWLDLKASKASFVRVFR